MSKLYALCTKEANTFFLALLAKVVLVQVPKKPSRFDSAFLAPATGIEPITTP